MAPTRKGGKKASKAAKTGKAVRSSKATKKARVMAGGDDPPGGGVDHPPVIITDGSAAIKLDENAYRRVSQNSSTHVSTDLWLDRVRSSLRHDDGSFICYRLSQGERVEVRATCKLGNGPNERAFTITGGNDTAGTLSPVIDFDHGIFPGGGFDIANRRIFRNPNRTLVRLEIFSPAGSNNRVHDCSVVATKSGYEITLVDDHKH